VNVWNAVQYVTTGVSLVAFVIAALTVAYRSWLKQRAEIIKHASAKDRIKTIAALQGLPGLPSLRDLPHDERVQVVLSAIRARTQHDLIVATALLILAVILAIIALLWRPGIPGSS
jgi:hypothetical protein